jgi:hypothetical protein
MFQEGRLQGLSGLGQLSAADTEFGQQAQYHNQDAALTAARSNQLYGGPQYDPRFQALQGMSSLFSATPGMAALFGNQMLGANNQLLEGNQQQQQIGNFAMGGRQIVNNTPSNFETGLGRVGQIGKIIGSVYSGLSGGRGILPGSQTAKMPSQISRQWTSPIASAYNPMGQVSFPQGSMSFGG